MTRTGARSARPNTGSESTMPHQKFEVSSNLFYTHNVYLTQAYVSFRHEHFHGYY